MTNTKQSNDQAHTLPTATLGGGCFWCLEAIFTSLRGVSNVQSGFCGGHTENPTYETLCQGDTGHAEVIQFDYDEQHIDFVEILKIFFSVHNPTTLNRQGNDIGTQYRSAIFYHDAEQKQIAEEIIQFMQVENIWDNIVTEITPATTFYPADDKHKDYFANNPDNPYCQAVVAPKLAQFRELFQEKLR